MKKIKTILGKKLPIKNDTYYNGCGKSIAYPLIIENIKIGIGNFGRDYTASIPLNTGTKFYGFATNFDICFTEKTLDEALKKLYEWIENPYEIKRDRIGNII